MTVSVIIVNWNTPALTLAAIASCYAQQAAATVEVIVVDNGSADDSVAQIRAAWPAVRLIPTGRNLGFAGGNNVGLQRASGELTLLLNSDAELRPGALQALLDAAARHPRGAAFLPRLLSPDGTVQYAWDYEPTLLQELWLVLCQARRVRTPAWQAMVQSWQTEREVRAVGLAALLVPMWVWRRYGLLATESFLFFEEADLSRRLRCAGRPLYFVPQASVDHKIGQSTGQVPGIRRRAHYLSRMWYYGQHQDRLSARLIAFLSAVRAGAGIVRGGPAADTVWRPVWAAALRRLGLVEGAAR